MAARRESLPTGVARTSPGDTRLSAMLSDLRALWKACKLELKKASLHSDKPGVYWLHGNTGARCVCVNAKDECLPLGAAAANVRTALQSDWSTGA
jgi:hypothetical protein